jgi:hypothetical protein
VDDNSSTQIANLVTGELFDEPYSDIVTACLKHRKQYSRPPGKQHIDDIFADVLEDEDHKQHSLYHKLITAMIRQADGLDSKFVLSKVDEFTHVRRLRTGLAQAVERYQKGGENTPEEIEDILRTTLKTSDITRDLGFSLADERAMGFLDRDVRDYCNIGIDELDELNVIPTRRELLAFLSPPNRGKSWFLTHCGKFGVLKGWKILHYTLENSDDMTAQRYFQTLFSGVLHSGDQHYLKFDDDKSIIELRSVKITPGFVLEDREDTSKFLSTKVKQWNERLRNLRIRRFPSGRLSFDDLERDLDDLRVVHKFEPDMILLDMPQLMRLQRDRDRKDYAALDELFTQLRGTAVERNLAMICPQQGNRSSANAQNVQAQHGAGSFGVFSIADNMITYSQTPAEEQHGLARLYLNKVRNNRARITICITQHYASGQFCMSSHRMDNQIRDHIKSYIGGQDPEEDEGEQAKPQRQRV